MSFKSVCPHCEGDVFSREFRGFCSEKCMCLEFEERLAKLPTEEKDDIMKKLAGTKISSSVALGAVLGGVIGYVLSKRKIK